MKNCKLTIEPNGVMTVTAPDGYVLKALQGSTSAKQLSAGLVEVTISILCETGDKEYQQAQKDKFMKL